MLQPVDVMLQLRAAAEIRLALFPQRFKVAESEKESVHVATQRHELGARDRPLAGTFRLCQEIKVLSRQVRIALLGT